MDIKLIICVVVIVAALAIGGGRIWAGSQVYRNMMNGTDNDD